VAGVAAGHLPLRNCHESLLGVVAGRWRRPYREMEVVFKW